MPHTPLIYTVVCGLVVAYMFGALATRLRLPPLIGYLVAGIAVGPFTPGFVADAQLAHDLAEIGVILLMFGVGLHFSLQDLLAVKGIAIPGTILKIVLSTLLGMGMAWAVGWPWGEGLLFGLSLSVASTVVLLKALQERRLEDSEPGRIAIGLLIVEDVVMVIALVLVPALSGLLSGKGDAQSAQVILLAVGITLGKVVGFVAAMMLIGRRVIPWLLERTAATGSRELFRLAVLAIALGVALGAAALFDVSFALGAFFAGMILAESDLSHRAAEESLPLRDAFAVLFFVSVGMLFNPAVIAEHPWLLLATLALIMIGKTVVTYLLMRLLRQSIGSALVISIGLAQIGEFSFILAALGVTLNILTPISRDLILASAILSILCNSLLFALLPRIKAWLMRRAGMMEEDDGQTDQPKVAPAAMNGHTVLVGFGRVGHVIAASLLERNLPFVVIDDQLEIVEALRADGLTALYGNAAAPGMLEAAHIETARYLLLAIPEVLEAGHIIEVAKARNPQIIIVARAHTFNELVHLEKRGATHSVLGVHELAQAMARHVTS